MFSSSRILVTSSMFFCVSSFNDEIGAELEASSAVDVCAVVDTGVVDGENDTTVVIGAVVVAGPAVVGGAVVDVIAAFDVGSAVVGGALGDAVVAAAVDVDPIIVVISADVGGAVVVGDVVVGAVVVGAVVVGAVVVGAVVDVGAAADVAVAADVGTPVVVSAADDIGSAVVDGDAAGVGAACVVCAVTGVDDAVAVDVRASIVAVKSVTNDPVVVAESVVGMSGQTSEIVDPKLPIIPRCVVLNCS